MEKQSPPWLQDLLDQEEIREEKQKLEMSKIMADRALAAISIIEGKINEVNEIAEKEINLIQQWNLTEVEKLQKKIDWLVWNLENYMKSTGEKTISLPHGVLKNRMGKDRFEVVDLQKFLPIGQRLGLVRITPANTEPDLIAIANYVKLNGGKLISGVMLTPGQPKFSYKTITKGVTDELNERNETETRSSAGTKSASQIAA
jgi:phage host-nuclease inhibitor protein Gam